MEIKIMESKHLEKSGLEIFVETFKDLPKRVAVGTALAIPFSLSYSPPLIGFAVSSVAWGYDFQNLALDVVKYPLGLGVIAGGAYVSFKLQEPMEKYFDWLVDRFFVDKSKSIENKKEEDNVDADWINYVD